MQLNNPSAKLTVLTGLAFLSVLMLANSFVYADDSVVDQINITVPVSCNISGTGMTSHNANINNGTYTSDIGTTTLHAFCNDTAGFAIYAAGYTGNEVGGTNSNKLVGTNASGNATIVTGLATTAGNPDVSNWAMKLAITQDSGDTTGTNALTIDSAPNVALPSQAAPGATSASFSNYHIVPNEYVKVAHKNAMTDMTASTGGVKLTTTYAAYISKTQSADTYTGQVKYTLVHPASHAAPSPYPIMQEVAEWGSSVTAGQEITAIDIRDNKTYTVARLADGNLWMTQNLDLDIDSNTTYTHADTDIGYGSDLSSTYGSAYDFSDTSRTWTPSQSTHEAELLYGQDWRVVGAQDDSWAGDESIPESADPGDIYWNGKVSYEFREQEEAYYNTCDENWENCDESLAPDYIAYASSGDSHYHVGNLYNITAAVGVNDIATFIHDSESHDAIVDQSICPAGWALPRVGVGEDSLEALLNSYGTVAWDNYYDNYMYVGDDLWISPTYLLPSSVGRYFQTTLAPFYYSNVIVSNGNIDYDYREGTAANTRGYPTYGGGYNSIRCLARPVSNTFSEE